MMTYKFIKQLSGGIRYIRLFEILFNFDSYFNSEKLLNYVQTLNLYTQLLSFFKF